jgi:acetyl-CoA acetyltransferase
MGGRANPLKDAAAIVGIGQTEFAKQIDRPEAQLAAEAVVAALRDAGIAPSEVDGLSSFTMETTDEVTLAKTIGSGDVTYFSQVGYGGGAGCATVGHAAMAIATGQAEVVVAWRARKRGARTARPWAAAPSRLPIQAQWTRPFGLLRPVDEVAMLARRYQYEYGGGREGLAEVALAVRAHANRNPAALMYDKPMTRDDYMAARFVSEPLCLFDNCLETDGALAVVLVSAERARDCPHPPALVHAVGQGLHRQHESMVNYYCDDPLTGPAWAAAFTPLILLSLEGYGFCGRGEAAAFVADGNLRWDTGSLPVNTSGGGLSEAYVHGLNLVTEGVRQLRGTSTSQVEGARHCLVTSGEGVPTSAIVLRAA